MNINVELKNVTYNKHNNLEEIEITENGEYIASEGYDAIGKAVVNVEPNLEEIEITENGEYLPSEDKDGFSKINVDVNSNLEIELTNPTDELVLLFPFTFRWNVTNLKTGENPEYYLFIDDILVYKGNDNHATISSISTSGKNHTCYVFVKTDDNIGFSNKVDFSLMYSFLYGFEIDETNFSSSDSVTYTDDCVNFTPFSFENDNLDYGDWSSFIDSICRPVMLNFDGSIAYELNHENLLLKNDNTISDIKNTSSQMNAFVEFKKIYMKVSKNEHILSVKFCDTKLDVDYHAYAFTNADGIESPFMYYSIFPSVTYDNKPRSIYYNGSFSNADSFNLENIYNKYYTKVSLSIWNFLQMLHVLISKNRNSQLVFGKGSITFNWVEKRLTENVKFSNPNNITGTENILKTFYIQSVWGFPKYTLEGYYKTSLQLYYKKFPPYDNINKTNYSLKTISVNSGYINEMKLIDDILIPSGIGFSIDYNQGYCDYQYGTNGYLRTGDFDNLNYIGLFNSDLTSTPNEKIRMIYHPPVI